MISQNRGNSSMPEDLTKKAFGFFDFPVPCSAKRWKSLAKVRGSEDFFSSDLKDEEFKKNFEKVTVSTCILLSEKDETYPESLDRSVIWSKFEQACPDGTLNKDCSGVIRGAGHEISNDLNDQITKDFLERIKIFLKSL
jgi:hypothetical protein